MIMAQDNLLAIVTKSHADDKTNTHVLYGYYHLGPSNLRWYNLLLEMSEEEGEVIVEEAVAVAVAESESFNVIDSLKSVLKIFDFRWIMTRTARVCCRSYNY